MKDSISVVIPTYNRSQLIRTAVESALAAIAPGDEILVIDDGSTDDTAAILQPYLDRIRYIRSKNAGPGAARNLGIDSATHSLIAFLDSDDEWLADKLYLQRKVMEAFPQAVLCFSDLLSRHHDGRIYHQVLKIWQGDDAVGHPGAGRDLKNILGPGVPFSSIGTLPEGRPDFDVRIGNIYPALMETYWVWTCATVVRKEAAGASFRFPEDTTMFEEWECFGRVARSGLAAYLDCETAIQNVHRGSRLTDAGAIQQCTARIRLLDRLWGADATFVAEHGVRLQMMLGTCHLRRAKYLIKAGRMEEAKDDLRAAGGGPWHYRLLTALPPPLTNSLVRTRQRLRARAS